MNVKRVVAELRSQYPGKNIVQLPRDNPSEIICEIDPTQEHQERSTAIAVIDNSYPHFHRVSQETYKIIKGTVTLCIEKESYILKEGDVKTVEPGKIHWATAGSAWVRVESTPGWTSQDHILVRSPKE